MGTSNLYDRIVGQHSSLENIMSHIPGYRGYKEATDRRASDRLVRQHIVQKLKEQFDHLVTVEKRLLTGGDISQAGLTSGAKLKFQTYIDRVNTAAPGYSGFYDAVKIGPDELAKIYNFDAALLDYVDKFKTAIDALNTAIDGKEKDPIAKAAYDLETLAGEANAAFNLRDDVVTQIAKS